MFSTLADITVYTGGLQYTGGHHETLGAVHYSGDTMSTAGGYHEYSGGVQYTGGYHDECGGYHEHTWGCSVHWGFHTNSVVFPMTFPTFIMISPLCTRDIPQCTHDIPCCTHDIPWCTEHSLLHCTPPVYCTDIMQGESLKGTFEKTMRRNELDNSFSKWC